MGSKLPEKLYKTVIVIWSEYEPTSNGMEITDLAREASDGDAYCSKQRGEWVDPRTDPDWDGSDFFGRDDDGEDDSPAP